jgi:hypothetical protein
MNSIKDQKVIIKLTVRDLLIRNVLGQKEVLCDNLVDFTLDRQTELIISHVNFDNIGVAL